MVPPRAPDNTNTNTTTTATENANHDTINDDKPNDATAHPRPRRESSSQHSENSQTAADFIRDQMQLEADAREAMPYVCLSLCLSLCLYMSS